MNKKSIIITIKKEIRSLLRDKKTLITLLVFPILIPMMIFLYAYIYENQSEEKYYNIGINYKTNTTEKSLMKECFITPIYYKNIDNMKNSYKKGKIVAYIDYNEKQKKYTIYTNQDSEDGMYATNYITSYLDSYNTYLAKLYLTGEDIDVETVYNNFTYKFKNLEGENFMLKLIFSISFTYIIAAIVLASTNMATSATAVEKENGTLETLLTFPIKPSELVAGKYLACVIASIVSSIIGLILTIGSIFVASSFFEAFKTYNFEINVITIIFGFIICLSASLFISGLAIAITSFSKTYKEAQSSSQVLNVITIIPMMISIMGIKITSFFYLIPIINYVQILMDIFSKEFNILNIFIVLISSIIYVIIVIYIITRQYKEEKVLFGI
ncbi:MAG: ABC transporter permease [Bacilli bacterium]|nr:ABC transporter permease [Bacilli bacterium]